MWKPSDRLIYRFAPRARHVSEDSDAKTFIVIMTFYTRLYDGAESPRIAPSAPVKKGASRHPSFNSIPREYRQGLG